MANIIPDENYYVLLETDNNFHLFRATTPKNKLLETISICEQIKFVRSIKHVSYTAKDMRKRCSDLGRIICGTCVSHLYEDLPIDYQGTLD
jgi:hypothetical protein